MDAIAANDLKRHGISAVEQLLANGPVHIIKRNQPICVVLAEDEYEKLTRAAQANTEVRSHTAMEWLALPASGVSTKDEIDQLRARHGLRTPDAIQAASALSVKRPVTFLTGDKQFSE